MMNDETKKDGLKKKQANPEKSLKLGLIFYSHNL
jgi:hypothetical protein